MKRIALLLLLASSLVVVSLATAAHAQSALDVPLHGTNPLIGAALPKSEVFSTDARVLERRAAGSYVYLRVAADGRERWAATVASLVPPNAEQVRLTVLGRARNFHSARLDRDFAELWFVAVRDVSPAVEKGAVR
jgi:hypothetical protein